MASPANWKESKALLVDIVRCSGCRKCIEACPGTQAEDPESVTKLSSRAFTSMIDREVADEDRSIRNMCRHCLHPSCVSVCPVGAIVKTPEGPVIYDEDKCMGCRYCMVACPFNIPRYEWDDPVPAIRKCDMCYDRVVKGEIPACAEACDYEATLFGTRAEMLKEAYTRIEEDPEEYFDHVFGEFEIGGTSVLFLAPQPLEELGFKEILGTAPLPGLTMQQVERVPAIAIGGTAALLAIWWLTNRRDEVAAVEGPPPKWRSLGSGRNGNGKQGGNGRG